MRKSINLQLFAGENNDLAVRQYQKEFKKLLQAVFAKRSYFADFFGGGLEALDGVENNKNAFSVKTSDIPVVVGDGYNKAHPPGWIRLSGISWQTPAPWPSTAILPLWAISPPGRPLLTI